LRNNADLTGGKPIAVLLQSISGVSAINPLVTFYDIHRAKSEELLFFLSPTPHETKIFFDIKNFKYVPLISYKFFSKIDWEYKGTTLSTNNLFQRYRRSYKRKQRRNALVNINGVLTVPDINKESNGAVYTCIVTSPSGEMARRAFEIQVIEAPVLEDLLLGNNLQEGQIVNIYCNVRSGDLPIHFEWLKDGKRIPSSLKVR
jgi:hypothetical protein